MNDNPFKGLDSYNFTDYPKFGGRDVEIQELYEEIINHNFTLVYGKSGVGKSSFLKAGLYPVLLAKDWLIIYIRVRILADFEKTKEAIVEQINNQVRAHFNIKENSQSGIKEMTASANLWEYFIRLANSDEYLKPIIFFDQFEEVFTAGKSNSQTVRLLLKDVAYLAENWIPEEIDKKKARVLHRHRPSYKVVIGMREDFLPQFQNLAHYFPSFQASQYRLKYLTGENAVKAIEKTSLYSGLEIPESEIIEVVTKIIKETTSEYIPVITHNHEEGNWEKSATDPAFLSFYFDKAYGLNLKPDDKKSLKELLSEHYEEVVKQIDPKIRENIETKLLSENGQRAPVSKASLLHGVYNDQREEHWDLLIEQRIIRTINVHELKDKDDVLVELIHDILVPVVRQEQKKRLRQVEIKRRNSFLVLFTFLAALTVGIYISTQEKSKKDLRIHAAVFESKTLINVQPNKALNLALLVTQSEPENDLYRKNLEFIYLQDSRFFKTSSILPKSTYDISQLGNSYLSGGTIGNYAVVKLDSSEVWRNTLPGFYKKDYPGIPVMASAIAPNEHNFTLGGYKGGGIGQLYFGQLSDGTLTDSTESFNGIVSGIEYLNQSQIVVSTYQPGSIFLCSLNEPRPFITFDTSAMHYGGVHAVAYDKANQLIYSAGDEGVIKVWKTDGSFVRNLYERGGCHFEDIELSKDGQHLLAGSCNNDAILIDLDGQVKQRFSKHNDRVASVEFSKDEDYILTGGADGMAYIWHRSGDLVQEFVGEANLAFWDVELTPDNQYLLTAGQDGAVKKWSTSGRLLTRYGSKEEISAASILSHEEGVWQLKLEDSSLNQFQDDESKRISFTNERMFKICSSYGISAAIGVDFDDDSIMCYLDNPKNEKDKLILRGQPQDMQVAIHPTEPVLTYFHARTNKGYLQNYKTGAVDSSFSVEKDNRQVTSLAYSPDGNYLVYGSSGELVYYDCSSGVPHNPIVKYEHEDSKFIGALDFSTDGSFLASGSDDGTVVIWSVPGFERELTLHSPKRSGWVKSVKFSPDGQQVLATYSNGDAFLYRLSDGIAVQEFRVLNQESAEAINGDFGADGRTVIVQYSSGYTREWEIRESLESFLERGEFDRLSKEELKAYGIE